MWGLDSRESGSSDREGGSGRAATEGGWTTSTKPPSGRRSITSSQDASARSIHRFGSDADEAISSGVPLQLDFRSPILRPSPTTMASPTLGSRDSMQEGDGVSASSPTQAVPSSSASHINLPQRYLGDVMLEKRGKTVPGHPESPMLERNETSANSANLVTPPAGTRSSTGASGGGVEESPLKSAKKELEDLRSLLDGLDLRATRNGTSGAASAPPLEPATTLGHQVAATHTVGSYAAQDISPDTSNTQSEGPGGFPWTSAQRANDGAGPNTQRPTPQGKDEQHEKSSSGRRRKIATLEAENVSVPTWVRLAGRVSAQSVCSDSYLGTVSHDSSLADVMAILSLHPAVLVERWSTLQTERRTTSSVPRSPGLSYFSWEGGKKNARRIVCCQQAGTIGHGNQTK